MRLHLLVSRSARAFFALPLHIWGGGSVEEHRRCDREDVSLSVSMNNEDCETQQMRSESMPTGLRSADDRKACAAAGLHGGTSRPAW